MFVTTITSVGSGGELHLPGSLIEVSEEVGKHLIKIASAVSAEPPPIAKSVQSTAAAEKLERAKAEKQTPQKAAAGKKG
jgi:hypothetical protein